MDTVKIRREDGQMIVELSGRIGSDNASAVEHEIFSAIDDRSGDPIIDAQELTYISSVGLRIILRLRKAHPGLKLINASADVYEILEMTGFTEMMKVEKAFRRLNVDHCRVIGSGANGVVYRYDPETVVKVYNSTCSLEEIRHERDLAHRAFVLGIPTAISYDIVRVGDSYGSVFELLEAHSLGSLLHDDPEHYDIYIAKYVQLLKTIHSTVVRPQELPDMKQIAITWLDDLTGELPQNDIERLRELMQAIPDTCHIIHGDFHTNNVLIREDEELLIDMETLSCGDPVFEMAAVYNAYIGFGSIDHTAVENFLNLKYEEAGAFWHRVLERYLGTNDEVLITEAENKAKLIGTVRLLRRTLRRGGKAAGTSPMAVFCKDMIGKLLPQVDSLAMGTIE